MRAVAAGRAPRFIDVKNDRSENDWYMDQPDATEALLRAERFSGLSWDPACGVGTIPKTMEKAGVLCVGSDLVDRGFRNYVQRVPTFGIERVSDFLASSINRLPRIANIVSNPPFNLSRKFADQALAIAQHKVAFLLPLTFLEGQARAAWLETTPLARVHVFSYRVSMPPGALLVSGAVEPTGGKKAFAWFVWEQGWRGPAQFHSLHKQGGQAAGLPRVSSARARSDSPFIHPSKSAKEEEAA